MSKPVAAFVLLLFALTAIGQPVLGKHEFAQSFIRHLRAEIPDLEIDVLDTLHLSIQSGESEGMQVYLDNAYRSYLEEPAALTDVVRTYTASVIESLTSTSQPVDLSQIVPVVKAPDWLEGIRSALTEQGMTEMPEYAYVPLNDELIVVYAQDTPSNIRYLEKDSLGKLQLPLTELRPVAVENLRRILPEIEVAGGDGLYLVTAGGNYEASLLLYDEMWTHENFPVEGEIVIGVPTRDVLLVTGTGGADNLLRTKEFVEDAYQEGLYALSPKLFVLRSGSWEVYE